MPNDQQKYFFLIRDLILKYGERFDKRHGNWIKLQFTDNLFFQMDSWNYAISLKRGIGEYDYWIGFSGEREKYLGMDFGGLEIHCEIDILKSWYEKLNDMYEGEGD
jgi:hypothetical protein